MRHAALLFVLAFAGCSSQSPEERQLAGYQQNAKIYFESRKFGQAMAMIDRGLAIEADDYQLRTLRASCLLLMAQRTDGVDQKLFEQALTRFQELEDERPMDRHAPAFVLYSALALQRDGMRHLGEATRLRQEATRAAEPDPLIERAMAAQQRADGQLDEATARLQVLVDRGESVRHAHFHLMQIAAAQRREQAVVEQGKKFLERAAADQVATHKRIEATQNKGWEEELRRELDGLRNEEIETRALLADFHVDRKQYQEARAHLDAILELDPARSADYYNRGRTLRELGEVEAAKADFRRFLATSKLPADSPQKTDAVLMLAK